MQKTGILADYLDRSELAAEWGVSWRTIARYENLPDGLPSLKLGGRRRYHVPTAMAWLASRTTVRNPARPQKAA